VWFESCSDVIEDAVIVAVVAKEWVELKDVDGDVEEVLFWTIVTDRGTIDIETRLSHNGYYGGGVQWSLPTSDDDSPWWDSWKNEHYAVNKHTKPAVRGSMPEGYVGL